MAAPQPLDVFRCPLDGIALIEASAGTGKTWNLCGLVLRLLLERRLEVPQILVVTFTNAATAELRERIRERIADTLHTLRGRPRPGSEAFVEPLLTAVRGVAGLTDEAMAQRLEHALQTFDEASIFTIHGFCQRALADTPFTAGTPLSVELATDDAAWRLQVVHDFWRRRVAGAALPPGLASYLLERGDSPERWSRLLARQTAKPLSRVCWPASLEQAAPQVDTTTLAAAFDEARDLWQRERDAVVALVDAARPDLNGTVYREGSVDRAAAVWDDWLSHHDALRSVADADRLALLSSSRLVPKKGRPPLAPHPFFELADRLLGLRAQALDALAHARLSLLRELLEQGPRELRRLKRERRVVAFDDMLANLRERLTDGTSPWLAAALRERFPVALVDEFQDTDPQQFAVFDTLYGAGDGTLFMVGDPKQAIYSFRHADLHTYLRARSRATAHYTLAENQRSTPALLQGLNALFGANARAFMLPGLDYTAVVAGAKPRPRLDEHGAPQAALQLWSLPRDTQGAPLPKAAAGRAAARACAGEIARLLGAAQRGEISLDGRALAASDIAVLVRSHAQGLRMRQALADLGVGSVERSQASIFDSSDAQELQQVLLAILEPSRERLLRAALATELMGFDAAALDALACDERGTLALMSRFASYRDTWLARGVGVMLRAWIAAEGVGERMLARGDGERRMTNLLHLAELLQRAASEHDAPEALVRWLALERGEARSDDAAQLRLESDRHLVQIVTIHKSKGLEYPIVFCPFLWDGHPGATGTGLEGLEYHDEDGHPVLDFRTGDEVKPVQDAVKLERAAEHLRLIYVALTRAVHRCVLVVGAYTTSAARTTREAARSLLHWLVAGDGQAPEAWLKSTATLTPAQLDAVWQALADAHRPHVSLAPMPAGPFAPAQLPRPAADSIAALEPPRPLPGPWWIGSYTSLSQGLRHEAAAVDHDAHLPTSPAATTAAAGEAQPVDLEADDILRFPRGALAGECLHAVFEHADFTEAASWPAAIDTALQRHPPATGSAAEGAVRRAMLTRMLGDVLGTTLPDGLRLGRIPRARRLVELEFNLPCADLHPAALAALLRDQGHAPPLLDFGSLQGYLRGFIDLVVQHDGRFHIVDWKSNHLGFTPACYAPPLLEREMQARGYHLQALLYTVALHRYLAQRLPDYDYDTHVGDVLYLFVRGMRPNWHDGDGVPCGVHRHRPSRSIIERLSALLQAPS